MTGDNSQQIQEWNGAVGAHWVAEQERMDALIRPFGQAALKAATPRPGERVLDVGCGCGDTTLALGGSVGLSGHVVGLDVSAPMLGLARRRAQGLANLTFIEADASRARLPGPFDLLYSRFGVMFFDDPTAAFTHLRQSLKLGGRVAFVCWQGPRENPWASVAAMAARQAGGLSAPSSDPYAPGPFAFADRDRVHGILKTAGFTPIYIEPFEAPVQVGSNAKAAADMASRMGPASRVFRETPLDKHPIMLGAIEAALAPYAAENGAIALPGRVWVVCGATP